MTNETRVVPVEPTVDMENAASTECYGYCPRCDSEMQIKTGMQVDIYRAMLAAAPVTAQEPVALPERKAITAHGLTALDSEAEGWNACLDAVEVLGPLYTRADAGEVERLRNNHRLHAARLLDERGRLRTQLAEQDALLRRCLMSVREQHCDEGEAEFDLPVQLMAEIDAALSTSAIQSLPAAEHEQ